MNIKGKRTLNAAALRACAEAQLKRRRNSQWNEERGGRKADVDPLRQLHELQVHQIELEMQNAELQEARDRTDALLEKYTDLYDFAPVGFFSLDEQGRILEINLTGSTLLGAERSRLINRPFSRFVTLPCRSAFWDFLARAFDGADKQAFEIKLLKEGGTPFWASLSGGLSSALGGPQKGCRVAISDITSLKQAQEAQRLLEVMSVSKEKLKKEIVQRQAVEEALRKSESHQRVLLEQAQSMQKELKDLSHSILQTKETERKRISRELHDDITQTLVGINVHLETLARDVALSPELLRQKIARTQRLVEKSVEIVHQFARELRPTSLDDLGLIMTLRSFLNDFMKRTGVRVSLTTFAGVERLNSDQRTVLYRIVQQSLANVDQHAHASVVKVTIQKIKDTVCMKIADNGKSFDVERTLDAKKNKRLGLIGMRERAEMLGGQFSVVSEPGQGTTIQVQIPFKNGTREHVRA
jgi:PAS domain S-box-containing protein